MKKCKDCCNFSSENDRYVKCKLTNRCIGKYIDNVENLCYNYNKDLTNEHICLNCKYFLGGGDWGLSCSQDYYTLVEALDKSCEKFKRRENND